MRPRSRGNVDIFDERHAEAGVKTKSTIHPITSRTNQGKIASTSVPAKLPMYANTLAVKPHADTTTGNLGVPNLTVTISAALQINLEFVSVFGQTVISNDAGLLQELFEQTGAAAQQLRLCHRFSLFICVTLTCSACFASSLGVAHQTSLRSRSTMMRHANSLSGGG